MEDSKVEQVGQPDTNREQEQAIHRKAEQVSQFSMDRQFKVSKLMELLKLRSLDSAVE